MIKRSMVFQQGSKKMVIMALGLKIGFRNAFAVTGSEIIRKMRPVV